MEELWMAKEDTQIIHEQKLIVALAYLIPVDFDTSYIRTFIDLLKRNNFGHRIFNESE